MKDFNEKEQYEDLTKKPLYEFYVRGVQFHQLKTVINKVKKDDVLRLRPEPENPYDPNAIAITYYDNGDEVMLGYVPKERAAEVGADMEISNVLCFVEEINPEAKTYEQLKVVIRNVKS